MAPRTPMSKPDEPPRIVRTPMAANTQNGNTPVHEPADEPPEPTLGEQIDALVRAADEALMTTGWDIGDDRTSQLLSLIAQCPRAQHAVRLAQLQAVFPRYSHQFLQGELNRVRRVRRDAGLPVDVVPAPEPTAESEALTELGNSYRFIRQHGENLRYVEALGWLRYTGQRWVRDVGEAHVSECAKGVVLSLLAEAQAETTDLVQRAELMKWALRSQGKRGIANLVALAHTDPRIDLVTPAVFDTNRWLLNTPTATLDLQQDTARPHRREDLLQKMTRVAYDPAAQCPRWEALMQRAFPDDLEMIQFLQRLAGVCLTGAAVRCIVFFWGTGDNFKTTILEVWCGVLGDYALQTPMSTLMAKRDPNAIPNDVARFPGSRLITSVESEQGQRFAEALVKHLTGGDQQIARFLFKEFFEFEPTYKLLIASNNKPEVRGTDNAIWNRIQLIEFRAVIPRAEQILDYHKVLVREEGPGILNWMLAGCRAYRAGGLQIPGAVAASTATYRGEQNRLADFLSDCCETAAGLHCETAAGLHCEAGDLYQVYKHWCAKGNEDPLSQTRFGTELTGRGYPQDPKARPRRRVGVRLKDGWQRYAEGQRQWRDTPAPGMPPGRRPDA
jgi:putative DNA primase/helicase